MKLLAEKVETQEDYAFCADLGCELFQGYFFCRPELLRDREIAASRLSLLEVIAALQDPGVDLAQLERLIARDVSLSFRLLRYINSAFFGLRMEVSSIGQALALLGVQNLRRWATLSVFASIDDKPPELTVTALIRGRFCELAGEHLSAIQGELFTLGMFSVIDALMDTPIEEVLASIPFPGDMRRGADRACRREGRAARLRAGAGGRRLRPRRGAGAGRRRHVSGCAGVGQRGGQPAAGGRVRVGHRQRRGLTARG